jgi:hypothetical protein
MRVRGAALILLGAVLLATYDPWSVEGSEKARSGLYSSTNSLGSISLKNSSDKALDAQPGFEREKSKREIFPSQSRPDLAFSDLGHESRVTSDELYALLNEANAAFQQANAASDPASGRQLYDKAILLYEKIIDQGGVHNAGLYYNLANAYLLRSGVHSSRFPVPSSPPAASGRLSTDNRQPTNFSGGHRPGHSELSPGREAGSLRSEHQEEPRLRAKPADRPRRDRRPETRPGDAVLLALRPVIADEIPAGLPGLRGGVSLRHGHDLDLWLVSRVS